MKAISKPLNIILLIIVLCYNLYLSVFGLPRDTGLYSLFLILINVSFAMYQGILYSKMRATKKGFGVLIGFLSAFIMVNIGTSIFMLIQVAKYKNPHKTLYPNFDNDASVGKG